MTQDIPGDGYYFSAMKAFVTRTAYANIRGDQMVNHLPQTITHVPDQLHDVTDLHSFSLPVPCLHLLSSESLCSS